MFRAVLAPVIFRVTARRSGKIGDIIKNGTNVAGIKQT
jgi:hypothetical protein